MQARLLKGLLLLGHRVTDVLATWDSTGDGLVDKKAWRKALPSVGLEGSRADLDALFDWLDADATGSITYKDLHLALKAHDRDGATAVNISEGAAQRPAAAQGAKPEDEPKPKRPSPSAEHSQAQALAMSLAPELGALLNQLSHKVGYS